MEAPSGDLVRLPVAVAVVVGALLVALVAVGAVVSANAQRLPTGPAVAPPPPVTGPAILFDPGTRAASVAELRVTLAEAPYACADGPQPALPSFASAVVCTAPVHPDYDSDGSDWTATTGVALLPTSMVVPGDVQASGEKLFASMRTQFFAGDRTTLRKATAAPVDIAPDGKAVLLTGEVHYDVAGVPSRYDRLVVVVVELADGTAAAVFSSRPEDTPKATLEVLDASLGTVTAR